MMKNHPLIGTWKLLSFVMTDSQGVHEYPFGTHPNGYIFYLPNGFMSCHLECAHRSPVASKLNLDVEPQDALHLVRSYNSYCGKYDIHQDRVIHHVELCLFSNWEGTVLERNFEVTPGTLQLSNILVTRDGTKTFIATWSRVSSSR